MKLNASIPVRLSNEMRRKLEAISQSTGISVSGIIRKAISDLISDAERKGTISLPVSIEKTILKVAEGKSYYSSRKQSGKQEHTRSPD